jgi:ribonuclease P/MRP protein subunit RPP40
LCKVFERLLKDVLLDFLLSNNLLNKSQHGFLPGRSCSTALLAFLETVTNNVNNNKPTDVVYLDFSKAFDSVPHNRLIVKLENLGFCGDVLRLIKSFLSGRQQRVNIATCTSKFIPVTSGVPQGSVLGPLLFVAYINDIDSFINSNLIKFADDVRLFLPADPFHTARLQNDLTSIVDWCSTWLLNLNVNKCACLHLGRNNPMHHYKIGDLNLAEVDSMTDLGILVHQSLKPTLHCQKAAVKAHKIISLIRLAFKFLDYTSMSALYKAFVRPILEYCSVTWCPYFIKDIEILERVQRRFTRLFPDLKQLPYEERLSKLRLETLFTRRLRADLITVFKIVNGSIDIDPLFFFNFCHDRRTRGHKHKLVASYSRLDVRRHFFSSRIVQSWNDLPAVCAEAQDVETFKTELSKYLLLGAH